MSSHPEDVQSGDVGSPPARLARWIEILSLVAIVVAGVAFRLDDLREWRAHPEWAFFDGEPIGTNYDGWFYRSLARDLVEDRYGPLDELRGAPAPPPRPSPPPLISVLAAVLARLTPLSLDWIAALLPALLAPLVAIPLFLLGRFYGGPIAGITAALIAVLAPYYIRRSALGHLDTDCLNVTFAATTAYLFLRFGVVRSRARYGYLAGGLLVYALFLWWWDQAPAVVTAISLLPLGVALAFHYRAPRREALVFTALLGGVVLLCLAALGVEPLERMGRSMITSFRYVSKQSLDADFPSTGLTVAEQSRPSLERLVSYTTSNVVAFAFSLGGIAWLLARRFKESLFLVSLLGLSVLAVAYANRFMIFFVPVLALGTGFALRAPWELARHFKPLYVMCSVVVVLLTFPLYAANRHNTAWPDVKRHAIEAMDFARANTPEDAVLWAWWDLGYPVVYYAQRATVNDGSLHGGERTVYTALPLAAQSQRLAANFMQFYVARGLPGIRLVYESVSGDEDRGLRLIKTILEMGPEAGREAIAAAALEPVAGYRSPDEWLEFFFPRERRPVYLLLDDLLTKTAHWWHWFGTWDIAAREGSHAHYELFRDTRYSDGRISDGAGLVVDVESGQAQFGAGRIELSHLLIGDEQGVEVREYARSSPFRFENTEASHFGVLMDARVAESVFNQLFLRHAAPEGYFRPLRLRAPDHQLWEVHADRLE